MKNVLDTSALSAAMRGDPALLAWLREREPSELATVPPAVAEIHYGIERLDPASRKCRVLRDEWARWAPMLRVLPWSPAASERFGRIKATLERVGTRIEDMDIAIAAIASAHDCRVLTANLKHFRRIPDIECGSWLNSSGKALS